MLYFGCADMFAFVGYRCIVQKCEMCYRRACVRSINKRMSNTLYMNFGFSIDDMQNIFAALLYSGGVSLRSVTGRFANESFRKRSVRKRIGSIRKRPTVSSQTPNSQFANV